MTEILTSGLLGLYNRINLNAAVQEKDVVDVTMFIDDKNKQLSGISLAVNNVMLTTRTESIMLTGRDINPRQFTDILSNSSGKEIDMKEYNSRKNKYLPEFNTTTNKIGDGYRKIGNTVMLLARAEFHINTNHDLFSYEYIQMLQDNNATKDDLWDSIL